MALDPTDLKDPLFRIDHDLFSGPAASFQKSSGHHCTEALHGEYPVNGQPEQLRLTAAHPHGADLIQDHLL